MKKKYRKCYGDHQIYCLRVNVGHARISKKQKNILGGEKEREKDPCSIQVMRWRIHSKGCFIGIRNEGYSAGQSSSSESIPLIVQSIIM